MNHMQEIDDLFELRHEPLNPPRPGHIGEEVYSSMWKVEMSGMDAEGYTPIQYLLSGFPFPITQRHATVLASIVCWFGTSCGGGFLDQARRLGNELPSIKQYERFLVAWALDNSRRSFLNSNIRTLEHCMTPYDSKEPPDMQATDYEVAEYLMFWLGTKDGENFLENCKIADAEKMEQQRKRRLAEFYSRQEKE